MTQLGALLGLRWTMIRSRRLRWMIRLISLFLLYLLWEVAHSSHLLDQPALETAVQLAPQAFLAFGVLAVVAPLTAGGGNELFPPDQLVAYPLSPRTQFIGGLVLAPVNLVWVMQIFALVAVTSYLTLEGAALFGAITAALFIAALTALGQGLAWAVVGLRQTRRGRQVVALAGAAVLAAGFVVVRTGSSDALLEASPTHNLVDGVIAGAVADFPRWGATNAVLLALLVGGLAMGFRTCAWALRRPGDVGALREARPVRRRLLRPGPLRQLISIDRASVWRAPALRRGGLVLAIMPGLVAAGAAVPWESLIVMPGLVAAGAGLLFGVNAFCLDGSGALWLASMPHEPALVARAKTIVLAETVLGAVAIAALAGSLRSEGSPTTTQLVAIATSGICATAYVVASCMSMSIKHPHRADLRGPRDQVSPPGALTLASARLALPAALIGACFTAIASGEVWWAPLAFGALVMTLCLIWTRHSLARYDKPLVRSRIVQVVSAG